MSLNKMKFKIFKIINSQWFTVSYMPEASNGHQCCVYVSSQSSSSGGSAGCSSVCGTEYSIPRKVCNSANDKINKR